MIFLKRKKPAPEINLVRAGRIFLTNDRMDADEVLRRISRGKVRFPYSLIVLSEREDSLFEILSSREIMQPWNAGRTFTVCGIGRSPYRTRRLLITIFDAVYHKLSRVEKADVKAFFD